MTGCWRPDREEDGPPDHLNAAFDWMSLEHNELYRMVHDRLNVEAGTSVAADWARLGEELTGLGDELADLTRDMAAAWEGETAELATNGVTALARWARHTGGTASEVAGCVAMAVDNAAHARDAMPKPVELTPVSMTDTGAARAFTSGGFDSATNLFADQSTVLDRMHDRHAEAARVMDQFQSASREVARTVPRFTAPDPAKRPKRPAHNEFGGLDRVTTAAAAGPALGDPAPSASGGGGLGGSGLGGSGGGSGGTGGDTPRTGGGVAGGAIPGGGVAGRGEIATAGQPRGAAPSGMGAFPMGGGMTGARDEDHERKGLNVLEESGFWQYDDGGLVVSAAVIGELPSHG